MVPVLEGAAEERKLWPVAGAAAGVAGATDGQISFWSINNL